MLNADLHIHSRYSAATSDTMDIPHIAPQAALKGLGLVGTGDCLHKGWLSHIRMTLDSEMSYEDIHFILTCEVEDRDRVHHLLIFPDYSSVESARQSLGRHSHDMDKDGRCHIGLSGAEIAGECARHGILVGSSHAFTPWTSVYKEFDSLEDCYRENLSCIDFIELGLSADSDLADRIRELSSLTFLTNSDAHSPWPHRLGREFCRLAIKAPTFDEVRMALRREKGRRITANVGLDPRLGKYHRTACSKCFTHYSSADASGMKWRCRCGGLIKKGVAERVDEIADQETAHPPHRPPYIKIPPLADIIREAQGYADVYSEKVQSVWKKLVSLSHSEISVLIGTELSDIERMAGTAVASSILAYRQGNYTIVEGGGGKYGEIHMDKSQKTLF